MLQGVTHNLVITSLGDDPAAILYVKRGHHECKWTKAKLPASSSAWKRLKDAWILPYMDSRHGVMHTLQ